MTVRSLHIPLCCLLITMIGLATADRTLGAESLATPDSVLLQQEKKIRRLQEGIEEHTHRITDTKKKEGNLLTELEGIEQRLATEQQQLNDLNGQLALIEEAIRVKQAEVAEVSAEKSRRQEPARQRLTAYYRTGDIGVLNLLFSATSLADLLKFKEYFHRMLEHDRQIIEGYRQSLNRLTEARAALQQEKDRLLSVIANITVQQQQLNATRAERLALLSRIKTEKKLYQRAVQEMREAAKDLTSTINRLKNKAATARNAAKSPRLQSPKKRRPAAGKGFASQKGRLEPPATGTVIGRFGRSTTEKFGLTTFKNGIDIKTAAGVEVHAIYDGTVAYAGVLRGYGNLVIIDHGGQYYTLASRIAQIQAEEGLKVQSGQTIGIMGDNSGLLDEGLHFEIRRGTTPLDPLLWLDKDKLNSRTPKAAP